MKRLFHMSNRVDIPQPGKPTAGGLDEVIAVPLAGHDVVRFGWNGDEKNLLPDNATFEDVLNSVDVTTRGATTYITYSLPKADFDGFYNGTANGFLWPLLHTRVDLAAPAFNRTHNAAYEKVNHTVAKLAEKFIRPDDMVIVNDYHYFSVGKHLSVENPKAFFLHIPPPDADTIENLESREQQLFVKRLADNLFNYDFVGLQSQRDMRKLRTLIGDNEPRRLELFETETFTDRPNNRGIHTRFGAFPVGVDTQKYFDMAKAWEHRPETNAFVRDHTVGHVDKLGVDRLDPAKGLVAKAFGVGRALRDFGKAGEHVNLLQISPYGRKSVQAYRDEYNRVDTAFQSLNEIFHETAATLHIKAVERPLHLALARRANEILVTSIADGYNIYIHEALAANQGREKPAVGILSKFTGAAEVLNGSVLRVDPRDPDSIAGALKRASDMGAQERQYMLGHATEIMGRFSNQRWQKSLFDATIEAATPRLGR